MCEKRVYSFSVVLIAALLCGWIDAATLLDYDFGDGSGTTVTDLSGNGNDGNLVGFADTSAGAGVFNSSEGWVTGGGLCFIDDGVRSYVETPLNLSALPGDFTVEFEANYSGASSWTPAIGSNAGGCCDESLFFGIHSNQNDAEVRLQTSGGPVGPHPWPSAPDTIVHHLALVYDGATNGVEVFVDGSSIGTATRSGANMGGVTTQFRIGNTGWAAGEQWGGVIFGVAISNEMLEPGSFVIPNRPKPEASTPDPNDGAIDVPRDATLSWTPGSTAVAHDVYLGTSFDDVSNATPTVDPQGVYQGRQDPIHYLVSEAFDPEFGTTYYWRIDEVGDPPGSTIHEGPVWSFTIESFAYSIPGEKISATASSVHSQGTGAGKTIDGSGLDEDDLHSTDDDAMWLSNSAGPQPTWIKYEFDRAYKLHEMWVWNFNQSFEPSVGFGLRGVTIEYSMDGTGWTQLSGAPEFTQGPGTPGYTHNTAVDFAGAVAKYVRITAESNWGSLSQYGLSEVRFFYIPVIAREPLPLDGATGVGPDVVLKWRSGREAASHDLYLSSSKREVTDGTAAVINVSEAGHNAGALELGKTYYWKIDEVNNAEEPGMWQGDVWRFSTPEYLVVDDIEDYNNFHPDRVWETWVDGWGVADNGSQTGHLPTQAEIDAGAAFVERGIVHGGRQSMPFYYDNSAASSSEATASVADLPIGSDWTTNGIKVLSLWFYGDAGNAAGATEQMYLKLNGTRVGYDGETADLQEASWHEWNIDLADFVALGVNLSNVTSVSIGFGSEGNAPPGGSGLVYFDDIGLYPAKCVPGFKAPPAADVTGDCVVDNLDIESMAADWLVAVVAPDDAGLVARWEFAGDFSDMTGKGHDGLAFGDPTIVSDPVRGQVLEVDGDDRVGVSDAADLNYGADESLTLTAWVDFEPMGTASGWRGIVAKGRTELGGATTFVPELYGFYVSPSDNWHVNAGGISGDVFAAPEGQWHHLTFVQDGSAGAAYFYIDGELVMSGGAASCDTTGRPLFIGAAGTDVEQDVFEPFVGRIDDVRIYNYALSYSEILHFVGLETDLHEDGQVDFRDYAVLASQWLDEALWP